MEIINILEIIKIDKHEREAVFMPPCPLDFVSEKIPEGSLVIQVRQWVARLRLLGLLDKSVEVLEDNECDDGRGDRQEEEYIGGNLALFVDIEGNNRQTRAHQQQTQACEYPNQDND
jgi:hypothetical protein